MSENIPILVKIAMMLNFMEDSLPLHYLIVHFKDIYVSTWT